MPDGVKRMNRRFFLNSALPVSVVSSLMLSGMIGLSLHTRRQSAKGRQKVLVLVQLDGGNDGLNTVIPLDQYKNLLSARKNILIPEAKVARLSDSALTGLHPSLQPLTALYDNKQMTIIQGVGYDRADLSHFRSIDIWHSGSSADTIPTGWVGRWVDEGKYVNDDPPAIQIGSSLPKMLQGAGMHAGMAVSDIDHFYDYVPGMYDAAGRSRQQRELSFLHHTGRQSRRYIESVKIAARAGHNRSRLYPPKNESPLADQLKVVARLIAGGLSTQVYSVRLKGFDTHSAQVDPSDPSKGIHATLLSQLAAAITAFQDDLALLGLQDRVLTMTYSEFGRRIKSNISFGSDHGTAAPVMIFGTGMKGGLVGHNPEIPSKVSAMDNLDFQIDFRSVYTSILKDWFHTPQERISAVIPDIFPSISLF